MVNDIHVHWMHAFKSPGNVILIKTFVDKWCPHDISNLFIILDRPQLPCKANGRALSIADRVISIVYLALVLKFFKDVVLHAIFLDSIEEHVNLLHQVRNVLLALFCRSDIDGEHFYRFVEFVGVTGANPGGQTEF